MRISSLAQKEMSFFFFFVCPAAVAGRQLGLMMIEHTSQQIYKWMKFPNINVGRLQSRRAQRGRCESEGSDNGCRVIMMSWTSESDIPPGTRARTTSTSSVSLTDFSLLSHVAAITDTFMSFAVCNLEREWEYQDSVDIKAWLLGAVVLRSILVATEKHRNWWSPFACSRLYSIPPAVAYT